MSAEPGVGSAGSAGASWRSLAFDLGAAAVLFVTLTIGLSPWYSERLFDRGVFRAYYDQGIYRYRIVGPEVVLQIDRWIPNDPLGSHLVVNGRHPHAADLFTAVFLLNAASMVAIVLLARAALRRSGVTEPGRSLVMLVALVVVAVSLSTVTPYDLPSVALILGILLIAGVRPPWDLLAVPLVVLGVLTRESALVAVAALAAAAWVGQPSRRRVALIAAIGGAGVLAYVGVRLGDASPSLWEAVTVQGNLARLIQWVGLGSMVVVYLVWRHVCGLAGLDGRPQRRAVRWFWLLASPYVATALLTGYWFEVRLLVPLVAGELWLRTEVARQSQDSGSSQSSKPVAGLRTSRSRSSTMSTPAGFS